MESKVAAELRREQQSAERALTPLDRLTRAQRLGDEALAMYARAHGLTLDEAYSELSRRRQFGRRQSACARAR